MSLPEPAAPADRLNIASVVDQVYMAIRERISSGSLPRGARVHQEDLALELGVSRTPVREALRRLAAEGLVEMRTNRGARVADVDQVGMRGSYEARTVIEPGAARLAAGRRLEEPLARMRAAVAAQRRSLRNVQRSFDANREFHLALAEASGNEFLVQFAERLWVARIGETIYERQVETQERMLLDVREHELIIEAIEAGDGRRAESLVRRHLTDAMKRSTDILGE
ncbi:MAG TPA: GntR family transcriptional regulator [Solirubrobacteraceae bacterium]|nr:GntR family transcriptional regulator [Solirubrobacteraceae bacterium]